MRPHAAVQAWTEAGFARSIVVAAVPAKVPTQVGPIPGEVNAVAINLAFKRADIGRFAAFEAGELPSFDFEPRDSTELGSPRGWPCRGAHALSRARAC